MTHDQIVNALVTLIPGAQWTLIGNNYNSIVWHCDCIKPSLQEIETEIERGSN